MRMRSKLAGRAAGPGSAERPNALEPEKGRPGATVLSRAEERRGREVGDRNRSTREGERCLGGPVPGRGPRLSLSRVQGHGGELDRVETYRGTTVQVGLAEKVRFEIAVSDPFVQPTIDALCAGARTGEVGDGKIFVVPLERAVRIRTGESDVEAVTPVGE